MPKAGRDAKGRSEALGPTREAMRHGAYTAPETRGALAVYTNSHVNVLGRLRGYKVITPRQHAAGLCFEATWVKVNGSASPSRDSTIPAIGGTAHETEAEAERMAKARARTNTILNRVGPQRYSLLVAVCVFGESIGRGRNKGLVLRKLLCEALDQCAIVYGIDQEVAA